MYEETIPIISVSHTNDSSRKLNYGSNDSNNNKDSAVSDANSRKKSNIPSSTMVRPHRNTSSKQRQQPSLSQNLTNIRFMVMLFTGITFFICILFVFTQSAISIIHDRHSHTGNYNQYRVDGILPDSRNIAIERSPSLSFYCDDNASSSCTFRQLGQIMVPSAYQNMIDTMQRHLFTSSTRNESNTNSHVSGGIDTNTITAAAAATITMSICTTCLQPPSNVNNIRKQILLVRDLLDIFSPIYSNTTKATQQLRNRRMEAATVDDNENDDPWAVVRKELDIGYTLIGKYQDLDHSHVRYTVEEISILQYKILQWYNQFTTSTIIKHDTNSRNHTDHLAATANTTSSPSTIQYLSLMNDTITTSTTPNWYTHTAESRLFWKGLQHEFHQAQHDNYKSQRHKLQHKQQQTSSIDTSAITILQLLFIKQVQLAKKYYMKAYQHVSVLDNDFEQIDYQ